MVILCFTSSIRASRLSLKILHFVTTAQSGERPEDQKNDITKQVKESSLRDIQILPPFSRLVFVLEGIVDGSAVSVEQMCHSAVGKHLLRCLRKNSDALCIHDISDISIENGKATISFSSSHPCPHSDSNAYHPPHLIFLSLKLVYVWRSSSQEEEVLNGEASLGCDNVPCNPIAFSRVSPFIELLDKVGHRLFSHHIIRRYPWIFGPYSRAIRKEQEFFPIIAKSLSAIFGRSEDQLLRWNFLAQIKEMRHKNALHNQLVYQFTNHITTPSPRRSNLSFQVFDTNDVQVERAEQAGSESLNLQVLEQFLTNMYSQGVKPWIKGLRGYSGNSEENDESHGSERDFAENNLEDISYLNEAPELDWSSSETDSINEFQLMHTSDVCDEDDFLIDFPEFGFNDAHRGLELDMSFDRVVAEARSAEASKCPFDADPMTEESEDPNPVEKIFLDRDGQEPNWSEMEDTSDGTFDLEFSLEPSDNVHGPLALLSGGLDGQECTVHVNSLSEYEFEFEEG